MKALAMLVAMFFLLSAPLLADATVDFLSDVNARIYLDDDYVGRTPVTVDSVVPGRHVVRMEDPGSDSSRTFSFYSPRHSHVTERFEADFYRPVVKRDVTYIRHGEGWCDECSCYHRDPNWKARRRNVSLGLTGLGLVTGLRAVTGAGVGGLILNELF